MEAHAVRTDYTQPGFGGCILNSFFEFLSLLAGLAEAGGAYLYIEGSYCCAILYDLRYNRSRDRDYDQVQEFGDGGEAVIYLEAFDVCGVGVNRI